jgi:hypothetical protein
MPVRASIDVRQLREANKLVKMIDPGIRDGFVRDLKSDLKPYARKIVNDIPGRGTPPLSGMANRGRLGWGTVTSSQHVTPGGGRGSLARIEIYARSPFKAGFKMADLAGTSNYTSTPQGFSMNSALQRRFRLSQNGRGGRFAWAGFMRHRPDFLNVVMYRLDQYCLEIERRMFR